MNVDPDYIQAIGSCLAGVGGIAVAVSIFFLWYQNRTLGRSVRSTTYQNLIQNEALYHKIFIDNPRLDQTIFATDTSNDLYKIQVDWTCLLLLVTYENIYVQYSKFGLIPKDIWPAWKAYIKDAFQEPKIQEVWKRYKDFFPNLPKLLED